jgi:aldehyde dehydrogenase family 7 protein A1
LKIYPTIAIGNPLEQSTLCGPLHTKSAVKEYLEGIKEIEKQGGKVLYGGKTVDEKFPVGNYVYPTIVEIDPTKPIIKEELFVPIMYVVKFKTLEEAIALNNSVPQGLSSSMYTKNL